MAPPPVDISFHYPHEIMSLLIDAIPCLCRSKDDVLLFFKGAGVASALTRDLGQRLAKDRTSIGKHEMVRTVLTRLNERGEAALRERREVVKRVVEFQDFSTCWPNDQAKARGLVAEIQKLVDLRDYVTRLQDEHEAERRQHREAAAAAQKALEQKQKELQSIKTDLFALFQMTNPWARGKKLEALLNRLFKAADILVRDSFTLRGDESQGIIEQIDGVVEIDLQLYMVEVKWWHERLGPGEVAQHQVRVFTRGHARGIFISATGYTDAAIQKCRETLHMASFVLCDLEEIVRHLEAQRPLLDLFRPKIQAAIIETNPFKRIL